ncbi:MAG: transporter substrate-binding domain-containing protein [Flammeovirgaceae bacterium]|nr:transporter substrate-binding domain-containing protein [Flammeovirgaceae bacterium]
MGFEYELLTRLAEYLGVSLRIIVASGVEHAFDQLNEGLVDVIAFPLTVTKARKEFIEFSDPLLLTHQVLVQRKPDSGGVSIKNPVDLIGKKVHVIEGTSLQQRLIHLSEEIGGEIDIVLDTGIAESESLIQKVAMGEIDYTVADQMMAQVNAAYYPNLDIKTILSVSQQIGWGVRKNAPLLEQKINDWLVAVKKEPTFNVIYQRYFESPRTSLLRMQSDFSSFGGSQLSPYDDLIKEGAEKIGWDWRLLAAMVYQESRFNPTAESWAGARGLMQLMPVAAEEYEVSNRDDPVQSVNAGVKLLKRLDGVWLKTISDPDQRLKFVLASYNVGLTHVLDARELTKKYGGNPTRWDGDNNVEYYLSKKSEPKYYREAGVVAGYCKCIEPINYIRLILSRYERYKQLIPA